MNNYYTCNLDLNQTANMVACFDGAVRQAILDDLHYDTTCDGASALEYVTALNTRLSDFARTGAVVGRLNELRQMTNFLNKAGTMAFVCGGPSVGKTRLLNEVIRGVQSANDTKVRVVRFNGRKIDSIRKSLVNQAERKGIIPTGTHVELAVGPFKINVPNADGTDVAMVADSVVALLEEAEKRHERLAIVLDEANAFLKTTDRAADDTSKLFNILVAYTKEELRMSAVLLSSDEGLPFRLQEMGLKTTHLSHMLVIGGATPPEVLSQLKALGMGQRLRELLVRIYGGHFWHIARAVDILEEALTAGRRANVVREPMNSIADAFAQWESLKGEKTHLVAVLEEVARTGFCPVGKGDPLAHVLTKTNVCTFLSNAAVEYFIDPLVRLERSGVAPSTQLTRVLIAVYLQQHGLLPAVELCK